MKVTSPATPRARNAGNGLLDDILGPSGTEFLGIFRVTSHCVHGSGLRANMSAAVGERFPAGAEKDPSHRKPASPRSLSAGHPMSMLVQDIEHRTKPAADQEFPGGIGQEFRGRVDVGEEAL